MIRRSLSPGAAAGTRPGDRDDNVCCRLDLPFLEGRGAVCGFRYIRRLGSICGCDPHNLASAF